MAAPAPGGHDQNPNVKKTRGRQKIEIKKIENQDDRLVTFSKRRSGIYKKASELITLTGAELAFLVFSPAGKAFSFVHPSMDVVINRFMGIAPQDTDGTQSLIDAHRRMRIDSLNQQYNEVQNHLLALKRKWDDLNTRLRGIDHKGWWDSLIEELNMDQLLQLQESFKTIHFTARQKFRERFGVDPSLDIPPAPFLITGGETSSFSSHHQIPLPSIGGSFSVQPPPGTFDVGPIDPNEPPQGGGFFGTGAINIPSPSTHHQFSFSSGASSSIQQLPSYFGTISSTSPIDQQQPPPYYFGDIPTPSNFSHLLRGVPSSSTQQEAELPQYTRGYYGFEQPSMYRSPSSQHDLGQSSNWPFIYENLPSPSQPSLIFGQQPYHGGFIGSTSTTTTQQFFTANIPPSGFQDNPSSMPHHDPNADDTEPPLPPSAFNFGDDNDNV